MQKIIDKLTKLSLIYCTVNAKYALIRTAFLVFFLMLFYKSADL